MGLFLNAHSPTVAEQLATADTTGCRDTARSHELRELSAMLSGIANGGAKSMVGVGGIRRPPRHPTGARSGADGVRPHINTAEEARQAISCTKYPTVGTRSVYFRSAA
jgi:4-hydroxy-2-oxoheptanedioate aldolase